MTHPTQLDDEALLRQCRLTRGRSSGPGGQHRNKVETQVTLHHEPSGTRVQAGERRNAGDNQRVALFRLRLALAIEVRTSVEAAPDDNVAEPSLLWRSRCRGGRVVVSPKHRDFPVLLAELFDALERAEWEPRPAAEHLGCSSSQLIKLTKQHPPAFEAWNRRRVAEALHRLK